MTATPAYSPRVLQVAPWSCSRCGALVAAVSADRTAHTAWHAELDRRVPEPAPALPGECGEAGPDGLPCRRPLGHGVSGSGAAGDWHSPTTDGPG